MRNEEFGHGPFSPEFQKASELIGSRWTGAIIYAIFHGKRRFSEISGAIPGINDRLLAERLTTLLEAGVLEKREDGEHSNRPIYQLTAKGLDLRKLMIALYDWALRWPSEPPRQEKP